MSFDITEQQLKDMRRENKMEVALLEHAILQAIINHLAEHPVPRENVIMAILNVGTHWQNRIIMAALTKARLEDMGVIKDAHSEG